MENHMLGIDGNRDIVVTKDAFSGLKAAFPTTDKKDSTTDAIQHFMGESKSKDSIPIARVKSSVRSATCT